MARKELSTQDGLVRSSYRSVLCVVLVVLCCGLVMVVEASTVLVAVERRELYLNR